MRFFIFVKKQWVTVVQSVANAMIIKIIMALYHQHHQYIVKGKYNL